MTAIPLLNAYFCVSCNVILDQPDCPYCAKSTHTARLAPWLDHEPLADSLSLPLTGILLAVIPDPRKRLSGL